MADFRNFVIVLLIVIGVCLLNDNFVRLTQTMPWTKTLKHAFKAAMKTGRIKKLDTKNYDWQDTEMREKLQTFNCANIAEPEWKEFERLDGEFRRHIATGNYYKAYTHPNPVKWWVVLNLIASVFVRDDEPLGNPEATWNLRKLKFAKRIMLKFPVSIPDVLGGEDQIQSEEEILFQEIVWCVKFVQREISPCFDTKQCRKKPVTKERLASLWRSDKAKAIKIIKNDSILPEKIECPVPISHIEEIFEAKSASRLPAANLQETPWPKDISLDPPSKLPAEDPFTMEELKKILNCLPTRKSPGKDGVRYEDLKTLCFEKLKTLLDIFNTCFLNKKIPSAWKIANVILIPKPGRDHSQIENWRPISLLSSVYKVFMMLIKERLMPPLIATGRYCSNQKGAMPGQGLLEHAFCVKQTLEDFRHESSKLYILFIDFADAFGSIEHKIMNQAIHETGIPDMYCQILENVYLDSFFQISLGKQETKLIARNRGIIQGCPWSVYGFELGIDMLLRWIREPYSYDHLPSPVQAYVDDIMLCSRKPEDIVDIARKLEIYCNWAQLDIKASKSALLYERRSGNNWYSRGRQDRTQIELQGNKIEKYDRNKSYQYLGYFINMVGDWSQQIHDILSKFQQLMKKLDICPLPSCYKIQAINIFCIPTVESVFGIVPIPVKYLQEMEDLIVKYVRSWLSQATNSNRRYVFIPISKGGLGIRKPTTVYFAKKLATYIGMLNSDDETVKRIARKSLSLHMSKRKVQVIQQQEDDNSTFGGYEVDELGYVKKNTKQCLSKSSWIEVNEICVKLGFQMQFINDVYYLKIGDEVVNTPQKIYKTVVKCLIEKDMDCWKDMESQGRLANLHHTNYSCSMEHLRNGKLSDKLVNFVVKARLQIAETNVLLQKMYPEVYAKYCKICRNPNDTISHVLNGCMEFKLNYMQRHNRIVHIIHEAINKYNQHVVSYEEKVITADLINDDGELQLTDYFSAVRARKPDIFLIDHELKKCFIVEISVPFDAFIDDCYEAKFQKYIPLFELLVLSGYDAKIIALIVGSLGHVHSRFTSGLKMLGIPNTVVKSLAKYASVSAMIGSHIIWRKRGKILF